MPTPWQRDLELDRTHLTAWIRQRLPNAEKLSVSELVAPGSSGFSNDTLLFDLEWTESGNSRFEKLVVRIHPTGYQVFPNYDLKQQFDTMKLLANSDVPVPKMYWYESNSEILGAPFYVMGQLEGRVPTDNPPYHAGGWMLEASPEERAAIWWGCIESMAEIHRIDAREAGFGFLDRPKLGRNGLEQEISYYRMYKDWSQQGRAHPTLDAAFDWVVEHQPKDEPEVLVWGDARIGNIIYQGSTPAAVLDWEMASLASPESDLAWCIFLDRHHSEGLSTPRLEGFPSYEETIARYESLTGFTIRNLDFYQRFAGLRFGIIMTRIAQQLVHYEIMDADAGRAFELNNPVTRLVAKMLDLPDPGETAPPGSYS